MLDYFETLRRLDARGITYTPSEFTFAILLIVGITKYDSFNIVFHSDSIANPDKIDEAEKNKWEKACDMLVEQPRIISLLDFLTEQYDLKVSEDSLKIKDINLTERQLKNIYSRIILNAYNNPDTASYSDLSKIMTSFLKNFSTEGDDKEFDRHFIQVLPPFNAICAECNKEFDLAPNVTSVCPHCGHKYIWDEEAGKFRY